MKNLLLMLVLANVLYFLWGLYQQQSDSPGVVVIDEREFGPPLEVATNPDKESATNVGGILGAGQPSDLEAAFGRSCVTIGPFKEEADASVAILEYSGEGLKVAARTAEAEIFVGHWVQIRDIDSETAASGILEALDDGGLSDAYLVRTEEEGLKISLGVFDDVGGAEKIELEARSLGFEADISPRMAERTVHFVDIGLPPGRGAGAVVEKYVEDRVLLREQATCPR